MHQVFKKSSGVPLIKAGSDSVFENSCYLKVAEV